MGRIYTTVSGETWDQIAFEVYGDEHECSRIMGMNGDKLDYFVFPAGVELKLPDPDDGSRVLTDSDYPAWRAVLNG